MTNARGLDAPVSAVTRDVDDQAPVLRWLVRQPERIEQPAPQPVLDDMFVDGTCLEILESLLGCRHPSQTLESPTDASLRCADGSHPQRASRADGASVPRVRRSSGGIASALV